MDADYIDKLLEEANKETDEYYVRAGARVTMNDKSAHIVTMVILQEALRKQLEDGKVWKLFALVDIGCGVNFSHPVPVMSEGRVDIRKLMNVGDYPVKEVTLLRIEKKGYQTVRTYKVVEERGYITKMKVAD